MDHGIGKPKPLIALNILSSSMSVPQKAIDVSRTHHRHSSSSSSEGRRIDNVFSKYWNAEGLVITVISAKKYRLSRDRLGRESMWFQDRFMKGSVATDRQYGWPIYNLDDLGISPDDFEVLIDAMDDMLVLLQDGVKFEDVASILRASTALVCPKYRVWAIQQLETMWSPDVATITSKPLKHSVEALLLSEECVVPSIRNRALYELARLCDCWAALPYDLYTMELLRGRDCLVNQWALNVPEVPFICYHRCEQLKDCRNTIGGKRCASTDIERAQAVYSKVVFFSGLQSSYTYDPLGGIYELINANWQEKGFCHECAQRAMGLWKETCKDIWREFEEAVGHPKGPEEQGRSEESLDEIEISDGLFIPL